MSRGRHGERIGRLEEDARRGEPETSEPSEPDGYRAFYALEVEWAAFGLARGVEPSISMDESGDLWERGGAEYIGNADKFRFYWFQVGRGFQKDPNESQDWWEYFLEHDEEAKGLLEQLWQIAANAPVPDDHYGELYTWTFEEEAASDSPHVGHAVCNDAEERDTVRRLGWTLQYNMEAQRVFSQITQRRDARGGRRTGGKSRGGVHS